MGTPTYDPIQTYTLVSPQSAVTFAAIGAGYTDLVLEAVFGTTVGDDIGIQFNGDTAANYYSNRFWGTGSANACSYAGPASYIAPRTPSNQPSTITTQLREHIQDYSNTTTDKVTIGRYDSMGGAGFTEQHSGLWVSSAAITQVLIKCLATTFVTGSKFTLFGIKAA